MPLPFSAENPNSAAPSGTPLLPTVSIVKQTMGRARRSVALAMVGSALIVSAMLIERSWFAAAQEKAEARHAQALRLAGDVRLANEQLTLDAQMAVATGEALWIKRHDSRLPELAADLEAARVLAPPEARRRFDARMELAHQELTGMRESAFEALTVGAPEVARKIFDGESYRRQSQELSDATSDFVAATVVTTEYELAALAQRSVLIGGLVILGAAMLGLAMWRSLARGLERSRAMFADAEDRVQRLASSDLLTGLANRAALHDAMCLALDRSLRTGSPLALLMVDLDRFKPINDRHGHMVGDLVLKEVAERLRQCLVAGELHARYGGDEFVVVVENCHRPEELRSLAQSIVDTLSLPMEVDDLIVRIGASVGVARFPEDAKSDDELLRKADSALYRAKANGRGGVCFYEPNLDEQVAEREVLEQAIRDGIEQGQFVPYFQPIVDLATREVQSLELLCRWNHPQLGLLPPARFIALAESANLLGPMMLSLLRQACQHMSRFPAHWRLSFNVAPQQIQEPMLVPQVLQVLQEYGVPPPRLDVELTETALVSDTSRARQVMVALKEAGITVTLDDFGTGYSSLSYLTEMSFDKLKIDRSFIRTLHERPQSAKIVDAVIGLSKSMGVQTVAEGIETEADALALLALGCGMAQGYWFGRPVPVEELLALHAPEKRSASGSELGELQNVPG